MTLNLPATPGLRSAAIISPTGDLEARIGQAEVDPAIMTVLVQGAVAALSDLGKRTRAGECSEVHVTFASGGLLVLSTPGGRLAVFEYSAGASLEQLRAHGRSLLAAARTPPAIAAPVEARRVSDRQSLMDALNAGAP